ncbi:XapX domain-containing protein [Streptomyces sp. NPDC127119]|uniref:XapX domain-containing protein n=1 Tax=Streptomyces sp. NPDC127119 TaxID=3345370 RepID=UPI003633DE17
MNTPKAVPGTPPDSTPETAPRAGPGTGPRIVRAGRFTRHAALAFLAGTLMGGVYWALSVPSPAPPLLGLTGLAGIVAGERIVTAVRDRPCRRRPVPSAAAESPVASPPTSQEPPHDSP